MTEAKEPKDPYLVLLDTQIRALGKLEEDMVRCRIGAEGHAWKQVKPDWVNTTRGVVAMAKQCQKCHTIIRVNVSARYGEYLSSPVYEYPDDYQLPSTGSRIRPQAVRAEWVKRIKAQQLD